MSARSGQNFQRKTKDGISPNWPPQDSAPLTQEGSFAAALRSRSDRLFHLCEHAAITGFASREAIGMRQGSVRDAFAP